MSDGDFSLLSFNLRISLEREALMEKIQDHCISEQISFLRKEIDGIDGAVVTLLNERNRIVKRMHRLKRSEGLQIVDKEREEKIISRLQTLCSEFSPSLIAEIYNVIFSANR
jgi:chorismate mutase